MNRYECEITVKEIMPQVLNNICRLNFAMPRKKSDKIYITYCFYINKGYIYLTIIK